MKIKDIHGRIVAFSVNDDRYGIKGSSSRSEFQRGVGVLLKERYPLYTILEEFPVFGTSLLLDFFLPQLMIAIECHGEQHYKFNKFFHRDRFGFKKQLERDRLKQEWCESNDIELIEFKSIQDAKEYLNE